MRSDQGLTLVFNDAVFNTPHGRGLTGWISKHVTQSSRGPWVPRLVRLFVVEDRAAFRAHLLRLAELPDVQRAIVSHHGTSPGTSGLAAASV